MTKREVMLKAIEGRVTWLQAADILGITVRHMRRIRKRVHEHGFGALRDGRGGVMRRKRIPVGTVKRVLELRRDRYMEFSVKHFHEHLVEKHGLGLSYTWTKHLLYAAGLAEKSPGRGKYRRKRERRPMVGMLLHLDGSTHTWLAGQPMLDLIVAMDDADGRILYARLVREEGTHSTLEALDHILRRYGRFCEFYTDRGSHFCQTAHAGEGPNEQAQVQVARVLQALGIRHIRARSPQARGRSERAFGTLQGRLPQELALAGITTCEQANRYLAQTFVADFNQRFTVPAAQPQSAFTPVPTRDLVLLLSIQHPRVVRNDNTVLFENRVLQLQPTVHRTHFVRCPVLVHQFLDHTLGVSYQGRLLARFGADGQILVRSRVSEKAA